MSVELIDQAARNRRNYLVKATSPGNATLNRRTQPNERAIYHRLGYNIIAASYSRGGNISRLSGSSLNRNWEKLKRDEKKQENERLEEIQKKYCRADRELMRSIEETNSLRSIINSKPKHKRKLSLSSFKRGNSLHFLSLRTKGKVRDKCTAFHRCLGNQKTFVTLTFINDVTDANAIGILNKFFVALRSEFTNLHYVRISERQPDTGRIHFHIIINKFLPVRRFNALWTLQQYNAGIVNPDISKKELLNMIAWDIENEEEKSEVQKHFNSFDVKKIRNINGLSYYLTKYITKNENKGFGCSAWHCSRAVSKLFIKTLVTRSTFSAAASYINASLDKHTGELRRPEPVKGQYHCLFYIQNRSFFLPEMAELETTNRWIVDGMHLSGLPELDDNQILKFYSN